MRYKNADTTFFRFVTITRQLTDRRTDRQTDRILIARPRLHFMQRGKNSEIKQKISQHIFSTVVLSVFELFMLITLRL